jgi:molybdopterin/thiamine biosynthesis adenylyltransferase
MPNVEALGVQSHQSDSAVSEVAKWLSELSGGARELNPDELREYKAHKFIAGWRLLVNFVDKDRRLDLLLDKQFPRSQPRVGLVDRPEFLTLPHVEKDGVLCLLPESSAVDPFNPRSVAKKILGDACELIEGLVEGTCEEDFREEFHSYWRWSANDEAILISSLIKPSGPSRLIRVWRGKNQYVVADEESELKHWLGNLYQEMDMAKKTTEPALLLWLPKPLIPSEYPQGTNDLFSLARSHAADKMLEQLVAEGLDRIVVLIGASASSGPCLGGIVVFPPEKKHLPGGHPSDKLTKGFRPGKVPHGLFVNRYFGSAGMFRTVVSRVDSSWVHGRDQDERHGVLREAAVTVLGCGSVGASVAQLLAKAGVGRLMLVDPERLTWANIGRHALGAKCVNQNKAIALSDRIRADFPHILAAEARDQRWEELPESDLAKLSSCNLIVSAMGSWASEGALNEWHNSCSRRFPIVYGWTEPHGSAGHAVAICSQGGCFQCGVDEFGACLMRVTDWPNGATIKQEPACGAVFQPYGPVELENIVNLIAELSLDCLLDGIVSSKHRIWVARKALVDRMGGTWAPEWAKVAQARQQGAFVEERAWPIRAACPECQVRM